MGALTNLFKNITSKDNFGYKVELVSDRGGGFYGWDGKLYKSDIIRGMIRPKVKSIGKLVAKHIRQSGEKLQINPDVYMRFLLEEPNPYMTGQVLQEKLATQLMLNSNAFGLIIRDENDYPIQVYPVPCTAAQTIYNEQGEIFLKFWLLNGKNKTFKYTDIIHLRRDFNDDDMFGDSPISVLGSVMDIVTTTDQGVVKAIKNSNVLKWLLKFKTTTRPEDIKKQTQDFVDSYLSIDSTAGGAAGVDAKYEVEQVKPESYVPNAAQMDRSMVRLYNFFNTNEKIVQSKFTEDEWNSYYEAEVEPDAIQLSNEYSRKLFTRKARAFGNKIIFEASNLQYASMSTKLNLLQMVDRGAMTPNEWRLILNMGPIEGGDNPIRRLDTAIVQEGGDDNGES